MSRGLYAADHPDLVFDDDLAVCTQRTLDDLPEYSTSVPTGNFPGKVWKARWKGAWRLGSYTETPGRPGYVDRKYRPLEVV